MFSELTVIIKDDDGKTLKKEFPLYEKYSVDANDPLVKGCIDEVVNNFLGQPSSVKVKINFIV